MGWTLLKLFGKGDAAYYLCSFAHVHACSPSYIDEEWKTLLLIPKQYFFGFLIIIMKCWS